MKRKFSIIILLLLVLSILMTSAAFAETEENDPEKLDISQYQFMRGSDGSLVSFKDNSQLLFPIDITKETKTEYRIDKNNEQVTLCENAVDNIVVVKNEENSDTSVSCWFRTLYAVECPEGLTAGSEVKLLGNTDAYDWSEVGCVTIGDVRFMLYVAEYKEVLEPGKVAPASLYQLYLPAEATSADGALFGEGLDVMVITQAIQTGGFDDRDAAMKKLGEISPENHPFKADGWLVRLLKPIFTGN